MAVVSKSSPSLVASEIASEKMSDVPNLKPIFSDTNSKIINFIAENSFSGEVKEKNFTYRSRPVELAEFQKQYLSKLKREFQNPEENLDEAARICWAKVFTVICYEEEGSESGAQGCSHTHFGAALLSFLEEWQSFYNDNECIPKIQDLFHRTIKRYRWLLKQYFKTASVIHALKVNKSNVDEKLMERLLFQVNLGDLLKKKELLFPLGWLLPNYKGHFLLSKISIIQDEDKCLIKLFNSTVYTSDELLENRHVKKSTSFVLAKEAFPQQVLKEIYTLLPLQIPPFFKDNFQAGIPSDINDSVLRKIYSVLGSEASFVKEDVSSPLSYLHIRPGNNCVPTAFHMLLQTLAQEEGEKDNLDMNEQERLKEFCDNFWVDFKYHLQSKLMYTVLPDSEILVNL